MSKGRQYDKRLLAALDMPVLYRKQPNREYDPRRDEVIKWMGQQPELMFFLFDLVKRLGLVEYNPSTGTWKGAEFDEDDDYDEYD